MKFLFILAAFHGFAHADNQCRQNLVNLSGAIASQMRSTPSYGMAERFREIQNQCGSGFSAVTRGECFQNLKTFINHKAVPDSQYISSRPANHFEIPEELRGVFPNNWEEIARRKGWKYIEYSSAFVCGTSSQSGCSKRRVMLILPEENGVRKFIQVSLPDTPATPDAESRLYDLITIEKGKGPGGTALVSHSQHNRSREGRTFSFSNGEADCRSCHAQGLRMLSPAIGSIGRNNFSVKDVNELFISLNRDQKVAASEFPNLAHAGPVLGGKSCVACHNEPTDRVYFGRVNMVHDEGSLRQKVVEDLTMPPSLLRSDRYARLKAALNQINELDVSKRGFFLTGQPRSYEEALEAMNAAGHLPEPEYAVVTEQLRQARREAWNTFEKMQREYANELRNWLIGDDGKCATPRAPQVPEHMLMGLPRRPTESQAGR